MTGRRLRPAAPDARRIAWRHEVDKTPFFAAVRRLTVLGLIVLPKYGGDHDDLGLTLIGLVDRHVRAPFFGYSDQDYAGFLADPGAQSYTA
jgi:hypothetical protein